MADFIKKYTENFKIFFLFIFFTWIKHIDLFQTMDKGGQNSCSLWKIFFGTAPYVLSFPKWRKTMEIWKNTRFSWHFEDNWIIHGILLIKLSKFDWLIMYRPLLVYVITWLMENLGNTEFFQDYRWWKFLNLY